jgi:hypothetical protein
MNPERMRRQIGSVQNPGFWCGTPVLSPILWKIRHAMRIASSELIHAKARINRRSQESVGGGSSSGPPAKASPANRPVRKRDTSQILKTGRNKIVVHALGARVANLANSRNL